MRPPRGRRRSAAQDRINARVRYIEGDMPPTEYAQWAHQFDEAPEPLTADEKREFLTSLTDVRTKEPCNLMQSHAISPSPLAYLISNLAACMCARMRVFMCA